MKVLFLAAYSNLAAASRIKVYHFIPLLENRGIRCRVVCFTPSFVYRIRIASSSNKKLLLVYYTLLYIIRPFKSLWSALLASRYDIVFIQEPIIPFGFEKIIKIFNKNIIFLFTDAVFLSGCKGDKFIELARKKVLQKYWKRMAKIAKYCLVENDYNKEAVLKFCPNVEKIAGPMDTENCPIKTGRKDGPIIIGWTGSPFTTKYIYGIKDALLKLSQKYNIVLRIVGAKKDFNIEGVIFEIKEWGINTELDWLLTFDIGIMPLTDDEWTRGKGGYKLLQYMSVGIPAVASPVGINNEIIEDGVSGFLAKTNQQWEDRLSKLIEDENLRTQMGHRSRAIIEERYSLLKATEKLINIFEKVLKESKT